MEYLSSGQWNLLNEGNFEDLKLSTIKVKVVEKLVSIISSIPEEVGLSNEYIGINVLHASISGKIKYEGMRVSVLY